MRVQALGTLGISTCHWNQFPEGLGDVASMAWTSAVQRDLCFPMGTSKTLILVSLLLYGPCVLLGIIQISRKNSRRKFPSCIS